METKTPLGRLRWFQLVRLDWALHCREEAGNVLAIRLADKAIARLHRACEDAGTADAAERLLRGHRLRMGAGG